LVKALETSVGAFPLCRLPSAAVEFGVFTRDCEYPAPPARHTERMVCGLTGKEHRLFWMRSAWWCLDCRQKVESCCEGGGCPSVADLRETPPSRVPSASRPARLRAA
jgi:hypothetical protein